MLYLHDDLLHMVLHLLSLPLTNFSQDPVEQ
jgi:hypothetical protein